ncbi:hypothetical protein TI04_13490, partial [Achromatium sp. WMS2]
RYRLTKLYVDNGYINSGALFLGYDNHIKQLQFKLIEGKLEQINVTNTPHLPSNYIAKRVQLAAGPPLHLPTLQERLILLLEDPLIQSLHTKLNPGVELGLANLDIEATEKSRTNFSLSLDNYGAVSQGEHRGVLTGNLRNIIGLGEIVSLDYGLSTGNHNGRAHISLPVTPLISFQFGFERSNALVIEEPADILNIKSDYISYTAGFNHIVLQNLRRRLTVGLGIEHRTHKTRLLDFPFSLG